MLPDESDSLVPFPQFLSAVRFALFLHISEELAHLFDTMEKCVSRCPLLLHTHCGETRTLLWMLVFLVGTQTWLEYAHNAFGSILEAWVWHGEIIVHHVSVDRTNLSMASYHLGHLVLILSPLVRSSVGTFLESFAPGRNLSKCGRLSVAWHRSEGFRVKIVQASGCFVRY